jgi:hypothetical protein
MQYAGQTGNLVFTCEKGVTSQFAATGNRVFAGPDIHKLAEMAKFR